MTEKIALFDMDGTLVDYDGKLKADLEALASPEELKPKFGTFAWYDDGPLWLQNRIKLIKSQPNWWFNLKPIESGFRVLEMAREIGFKIHILTKGPRHTPQAWSEKLLWCQKYIASNVEITITQDKGMVYGRVLVDDYPEYMERWLKYRPRGLGIMPTREYNQDFNHKNVIKYNDSDWNLVREKLQMAFDRKDGSQ